MTLEDHSCPKLARGVRVQTDVKTGEPVLLFPEGVLYLSETAREIVAHCTGDETLANIISALAEEYDADPATLRQDVLDCLTDLYHRKLVVF